MIWSTFDWNDITTLNVCPKSQAKIHSVLSKAINLFFIQSMTFHYVIAQEIKTLFIDLIMDEIWVLK